MQVELLHRVEQSLHSQSLPILPLRLRGGRTRTRRLFSTMLLCRWSFFIVLNSLCIPSLCLYFLFDSVVCCSPDQSECRKQVAAEVAHVSLLNKFSRFLCEIRVFTIMLHHTNRLKHLLASHGLEMWLFHYTWGDNHIPPSDIVEAECSQELQSQLTSIISLLEFIADKDANFFGVKESENNHPRVLVPPKPGWEHNVSILWLSETVLSLDDGLRLRRPWQRMCTS
jgi:hypothetical protein